MEGLGFAEVFSHIIRQLFQLLLDLSHELLPIIKVPFKIQKEDQSVFCWFTNILTAIIPLLPVVHGSIPYLSSS